MEVLDSLGVVDQILAQGYPVNGVSVMRGGREIVRFALKLDQGGRPAPRPDQPYRSVVAVNQAVVEGVLRDKLARLGGQVERQRELRALEGAPDGLVAHVADPLSATIERVGAKWLVGCDGAHSTVRELLNLPQEGETYPEHLILADVHLKGDLPQGVTIMWLNDEGLLSGIPFREPGLWRLMAVVTPDAHGSVPQASVELFQRLLAHRAGDTTNRLGEPVWLSNFMVHHRMVPRYRKGRVFVAGDAAHIHSPAGGQGMNTGIQDTYNLGWKLALVINGMAPESLLDTYESERLPVARKVLQETDANQRFGISHGRMEEFLRNHIVFPVLSVPALRDRFIEFALRRGSELDINYRPSRLSEQYDRFGSGPEAGGRAPDGLLLERSEARTSVFAQFRGPEFRLLLFEGTTGNQNTAELARIGRNWREMTGGLVRCCLIAGPRDTGGQIPSDTTVLHDPDHGTHETYGANTACLYLVRPDGYVGFRSRVASESKLGDYMRRNFITEGRAGAKSNPG